MNEYKNFFDYKMFKYFTLIFALLFCLIGIYSPMELLIRVDYKYISGIIADIILVLCHLGVVIYSVHLLFDKNVEKWRKWVITGGYVVWLMIILFVWIVKIIKF